MNERLRAYYGTDASCSHSRFRLAWTDDLTEKRESEFGDPPVKEVREAPKYAYIRERWILEVHLANQIEMPDLKTYDHYEPLWLFTVNKGEYYRPTWNDIEMMVKIYIAQMTRPIQKKNSIIVANEAEMQRQHEEDELYEIISQGRSFLGEQLREGEAVSFANVKKFGGES